MNKHVYPFIPHFVKEYSTSYHKYSLQAHIAILLYLQDFHVFTCSGILYDICMVAAVSDVDRIDRRNSTSKPTNRLAR